MESTSRRFGPLVLAASSLAAGVTAAIGIAAAPGPSAAPWVGGASDSLVGIWESDQHSGQPVSIHRLAGDVFYIASLGRFAAVGFGDRPEFVAAVRWEETSESADAPQVLRIRRLDPARLEARFCSDVRTVGGKREVWSFKNGFGVDARQPPAADRSGEVLPAFGESVYVDELPYALERIPPDYPEWARQKGIDGTVIVQALIGKDGWVKDARVVNSIPALDDYALGAVRQWRFQPARRKGAPVAVWVAIPVRFVLR